MSAGGFYILGRAGQSVAWYATRAEAERECRRLNMRGGCVYRVEPDTGAGSAWRLA